MPFAAIMLAAYARKWNDSAFFCQWESTVRRALDCVPIVGGLAYNDPGAPNARCSFPAADAVLNYNPATSFGFEDSVIIPGRQLTVRLLELHAAHRTTCCVRLWSCVPVHVCVFTGQPASRRRFAANGKDGGNHWLW